MPEPGDRRPHVHLWVDPSCSWTWQAALWLRQLRDDGHLTLSWDVFSLEVETVGTDVPLHEAALRYGDALAALTFAGRTSEAAFESLFVALGRRLHEDKEQISDEVLRASLDEAGIAGHPDRPAHDPDLAEDVVQAFREARKLDVFGVPSIRIDEEKPLYGPIIAVAPSGEDALAFWRHVRGISRRDDFFELKRWPRDIRPGGRPVG
jgi:protein-disulfide isomerase-like protein with CxxC motif